MNPIFYEKRNEGVFIGDICKEPFPSHVHDVTEIICITEGHMIVTLAGAQMTVMPGDILTIFPAIPHSYDFVSADAQGLAMIFAPDTISEFTHSFRCMTLTAPLLNKKSRKPQELGVLIERMSKMDFQKNQALKLGYLHLFLSYLFTALKLQPLEKHVQSGLSYQVLHYISEHFTEPLTLETTARALGISRIHLSHIFSQQLRINFRQYINTLRIDRACFLLRDPSYSISQIVYLCGYGNPRTFHRAFLAQCQMPPKQYRARFIKSDQLPDDDDAFDELQEELHA